MIDKVFGKEENWTKREKELYVRIRPDLLDAIIRAGSWDMVKVPSDIMDDLKAKHKKHLPNFSRGTFMTLMIMRGIETLEDNN